MLMHHADAERDGIVRRRDALHLAVDEYVAAVSRVEAVSDAHRRRFARAVLADDGMNRPRLNLDAHMVVRQHVPEAFRDVSQFKHGQLSVVSCPKFVRCPWSVVRCMCSASVKLKTKDSRSGST
jgi:hypothetical protein